MTAYDKFYEICAEAGSTPVAEADRGRADGD